MGVANISRGCGKIEGVGVIPVVIVVHNYVGKKLNTKIKRIVTHDCIKEGPFQQSINSTYE